MVPKENCDKTKTETSGDFVNISAIWSLEGIEMKVISLFKTAWRIESIFVKNLLAVDSVPSAMHMAVVESSYIIAFIYSFKIRKCKSLINKIS